MDTANITTVVFDIGNVLLTWNPENMFSRIFGRNDFKKHPLKSLIGNEIWLQLDRGTITKKKHVPGSEKSTLKKRSVLNILSIHSPTI